MSDSTPHLCESAFQNPVLLIGHRGLLGTAFRRALDNAGLSYIAVGRDSLDVRDADALARIIDGDLAAVINCAGIADAARAEDEPSLTMALNAHAPGQIARLCAKAAVPLVHFTSPEVFDGRIGKPWGADDDRRPVTLLGHSQAIGEDLITASGARHLLIRTGWLYAPWAPFGALAPATALSAGQNIDAHAREAGSPASAEMVAQATLSLLTLGCDGVWHLADRGYCTRYELARFIASTLGSASAVRPAHMPAAGRPEWSVLDTSPARARLGQPARWQDCLRQTLFASLQLLRAA